jgi:hypothetical protein
MGTLFNTIPCIRRYLDTLPSRYLTAATIFRGKISSREVSVSVYSATNPMTFVYQQAEVCFERPSHQASLMLVTGFCS